VIADDRVRLIYADTQFGDPQAWLTDTIARIAEHKVNRIDELQPWRYAKH